MSALPTTPTFGQINTNNLQMVEGYYTLTQDYPVDSTFTFKKGEKIYGTFLPNLGVLTPNPMVGKKDGIRIPLSNFSNIMEEYNKNLINNQLATTKRKADYEQSKIDFQKNAPLEDRFYQLFGLEYRPNGDMFGFLGTSTFKGRFYLTLALVAGYFAYKKFKK
jgi:hypothetical protein